MHYKISIPSPCSQPWDEMTPENNGRFCHTCEKTVVDFTLWSDKKILAYALQHPGTCIHVDSKQLKNPARLMPGRNERMAWKRWLIMAALPLFIQTVHAQIDSIKTEKIQTIVSQKQDSIIIPAQCRDSLQIELVDDLGEPASFATCAVFRNGQPIDNVTADLKGVVVFHTQFQPDDKIKFLLLGLVPLTISYETLTDKKDTVTGKTKIIMIYDVSIKTVSYVTGRFELIAPGETIHQSSYSIEEIKRLPRR